MAAHVLISMGKELDGRFPDRQARCRGFNTYGPWKLVGGMNKGHPNREERSGAVEFFAKLL